MNQTDWEKAKELFSEALDWPAETREARLREACGSNDELFNEVASLLGAHNEDEHLIEKHALRFDAEPVTTGKTFGSYRIVREIGHGGMGAVFLAERNDGEFDQQVALKIVRQTIISSDLERQFRRERQILAKLNHANIAKLLDGGVSESGEPFLAMEFVDGKNLLSFTESKSSREKLELFIKICAAVEFAHRNLVVHHDIKPSNILVTADGVPKLLDFGLARIHDENFGGDETKTAFRALTPAYASPEQLRGEQVTTASDIYSLGVVLYEMLSGEKPFEFENKSLDEILRTITNTEPRRLNTVGDATKRKQDFSGDLETIVSTALRKEPERRYKSVAAFSEDISRYLTGLPITARPSTFSYRATKFFGRNKLGVSAAALIVLAILSGVAVSLWQASVARRERDRAEYRFNDVRKLSNSLLFEITPRIERLSGSTEARQILVRRALEYLDSLAGESQNDPELQAELASAYEKIGELQGNSQKPNLGDFDGAAASYEKARAIRLRLPQTFENRRSLAENYRSISEVQFVRNEVTESLNTSVEALRIYDELNKENPGKTELKLAAIETEIEYGATFSSNNQYSQAIPMFQKIALKLTELDQDSPETQRLVAKNLAQLGNALSWDGRQEEAEVEMAKAVALAEKLLASVPNDSFVRQSMIQIYTLSAGIFDDVKNEESLKFAEKAFLLAKLEADSDPANVHAKFNAARTESRVGTSLISLNRPADAIKRIEGARIALEQMTKQDPANLSYQRSLAIVFQRLGDIQTKTGADREAIASYRETVRIFDLIVAANEKNLLVRRDLALALKLLGNAFEKIGDLENATDSLNRALKLFSDLESQNALGEVDKKLLTEVKAALLKIPPKQ